MVQNQAAWYLAHLGLFQSAAITRFADTFSEAGIAFEGRSDQRRCHQGVSGVHEVDTITGSFPPTTATPIPSMIRLAGLVNLYNRR